MSNTHIPIDRERFARFTDGEKACIKYGLALFTISVTEDVASGEVAEEDRPVAAAYCAMSHLLIEEIEGKDGFKSEPPPAELISRSELNE